MTEKEEWQPVHNCFFPKTSYCISSEVHVVPLLSHVGTLCVGLERCSPYNNSQTLTLGWAGHCWPPCSSAQWWSPHLAHLHKPSAGPGPRPSVHPTAERHGTTMPLSLGGVIYMENSSWVQSFMAPLPWGWGLCVALSFQTPLCWAWCRSPWEERAIRVHWATWRDPRWQICRITENTSQVQQTYFLASGRISWAPGCEMCLICP